MNEDAAKVLLERVLEFVKENEPEHYYRCIIDELEEEGLEEFLKSNSLWGGSGSIADQVGFEGDGRDKRRIIESLLIDLGEFQIKSGVLNTRTNIWTEVFREWKENKV